MVVGLLHEDGHLCPSFARPCNTPTTFVTTPTAVPLILLSSDTEEEDEVDWTVLASDDESVIFKEVHKQDKD